MKQQNGNLKHDQLARKYRAFLKDVSLLRDMNRVNIFGSITYGRGSAYLGSNEGAYEELVKTIGKEYPNLSSDFLINSTIQFSLKELVEQYLAKAPVVSERGLETDSILTLIDETTIDAGIKTFLERIRVATATHKVVIPLMGLRFSDTEFSSEIRFNDCILYANRPGILAVLLENTEDEIGSGSLYGQILDKSDAFIVTEIAGDFDFVLKEAYKKAEGIVHILNFYLASCQRRENGYRKINLVGRSTTADSKLILVMNSEHRKLGSSWSRTEILTEEINGPLIDIWKRQNLIKILFAFSKEFKPSEINARIQRAIIWYSKGVSANDGDEQFVGLSVALESLLVGSEGKDKTATTGSISQKLADRVAFLLGKNIDERMRYARETKHFYGLRSKIVHEGQEVSMENLLQWENIVRKAIHVFVHLGFETWEKFEEWETRQKYTVNAE